ncbi:cytochrome P450 [Aspergillus steynii IBT 23096]|uniref:Cytochrome P450 n=1 Tax=Aspergillus steynii IBT 23096 TaxID=1392250 RepID=A0A2I2G0D0_9EURO|nr:cytochrome P450 [Aspergillus steynii IBT 23096]PLB46342.1 cytochrome P450 [Aspergillus steynii IBT 23096]
MWLVSESLALVVLVAVTAPLLRPHGIAGSSIPLVNSRQPFELGYTKARQRCLADMSGFITKGLGKAKIRNSSALSVGRFMAERLHAHLAGFEPWRQVSAPDRLFPETIRTRLMQPLDTRSGKRDGMIEWHRVVLKPSALAIVYSIDSFVAADELHRWPKVFRPVIAWISPSCRKIRGQLREARALMEPILRQRSVRRETGVPAPHDDALEWMEECARGRPYDPAVMAQIGMATVSLHSTADMLTQVLYDLCGRDDLILALRDEVRSVVEQKGLTVSALHDLQLMDSTLKESQRLKPGNATDLHRTDAIVLSDGTRIPRDSYIIVSADRRFNPDVYPNPATFDAYRSMKLRQTAGKETHAQVNTPSPEHLAWGLGKHACPGRNLVVTEIKIALCHILLKYDIKLMDNVRPPPVKNGIAMSANSTAAILVRRR